MTAPPLSQQALLLELQQLKQQLQRTETAKRRAEEANARLAFALHSTNDIVSIIDRKARLLFLNAMGTRILGVTDVAPLEGKPFLDRYSWWAKERLTKEALPQATQTGSWEGRVAFLDPDGKDLPFFLRIHTQKGPGSRIYFACVHTSHDVFEQVCIPSSQQSFQLTFFAQSRLCTSTRT
jgi:PAS domain-containing protein